MIWRRGACQHGARRWLASARPVLGCLPSPGKKHSIILNQFLYDVVRFNKASSVCGSGLLSFKLKNLCTYDLARVFVYIYIYIYIVHFYIRWNLGLHSQSC